MPPEDWRQTRDVAWIDCEAVTVDLCYRFLHVNCVPVGDSVQNQAKCAELFFLPLPQSIFHFTAIPVIDFAGQLVSELLAIELNKNAPAEIGRLVDVLDTPLGLSQQRYVTHHKI